MNLFIEKIFKGESDDFVHRQFQKFSKGVFQNRAVLKVTQSKKGFSAATTHEYANELVLGFAKKLGNEKTKITGALISTKDLSGEINFKDKKQFMGVKQYIIDDEMSGSQIMDLYEKFPDVFFALSFSVHGSQLIVKPKSPKSAKPSTKAEDKPKPDFCKIKTTDRELIRSLVFDVNSFKVVEANHTFVISDIILPSNAKTPEEMRRDAKRKGTVVRMLNVDGREAKSERSFVA